MIKIMVVEDEPLVRKGLIMTTPWESYGCEIIGEAANGLEGVEKAFHLKPDLIFSDIRMPEMDGIEMIQELKGRIDAEYVVISGYSEFDYAKEAVRLGVKDYLLKPIDDQELEQVLLKLVSEIHHKKQIQKIQANIDQLIESKILYFKENILENFETSKGSYIKAAVEYIKDHYPEDITVKNVADALFISESYLSRLFKSETNMTFIEYLTNFRIKRAIALLKEKTVKVYEVSKLVGYSDSNYFSAVFKKMVGVTPTEFKDGLN